MKVVGVVLHPERDCSGAVGSILDWAARRQIQVLGIDTEIRRLACTAEPVTAEELRRRATWSSASAATARCCVPCGWLTGSVPRSSG